MRTGKIPVHKNSCCLAALDPFLIPPIFISNEKVKKYALCPPLSVLILWPIFFCRYPNTSCEVLTSDVHEITDKLAGEEALLSKIYSFLESEGPLNPLLASFFSKVMGLLITRKSQLVRYLIAIHQFILILMLKLKIQIEKPKICVLPSHNLSTEFCRLRHIISLFLKNLSTLSQMALN